MPRSALIAHSLRSFAARPCRRICLRSRDLSAVARSAKASDVSPTTNQSPGASRDKRRDDRGKSTPIAPPVIMATTTEVAAMLNESGANPAGADPERTVVDHIPTSTDATASH